MTRGVEHLGRPALPLGVAQVHPQQVAGEQRRLLAALARLDLEDDVLAVVGVAGHQQAARSGSSSSPLRASSCSASAAKTGPRPPARGPRRARRPAVARYSVVGVRRWGPARRSDGRGRGPGSASACTPGSARARSSSACSDASSPSRSNTVVPPLIQVDQRTAGPSSRACGGGLNPAGESSGPGVPGTPGGVTRAYLLSLLLSLALVPTGFLPKRRSKRATRPPVSRSLLARVERVAGRADVGVDLAVRGRAPGGEGVPTATGHRSGTVGRVNFFFRLHGYSCLVRSPGRRVTRHGTGRPFSGVNPNLRVFAASSVPDATTLRDRCRFPLASPGASRPASGVTTIVKCLNRAWIALISSLLGVTWFLDWTRTWPRLQLALGGVAADRPGAWRSMTSSRRRGSLDGAVRGPGAAYPPGGHPP